MEKLDLKLFTNQNKIKVREGLQRLSIALPKLKAGNNSEILLN